MKKAKVSFLFQAKIFSYCLINVYISSSSTPTNLPFSSVNTSVSEGYVNAIVEMKRLF